MKSILLLTICAPIFLMAQADKSTAHQVDTLVTTPHAGVENAGIKWVENLTWHEVVKKAKKENKYIFVDCFATWCEPCLKMDKNVYENDSVGVFLNTNFISVKVQMDSTRADNKYTRKWYHKARKMRMSYQVAEYPTFLFFSPKGKIVHKDYGAESSGQFIKLAQDALNPTRQYYALLKAYKHGNKDYANRPYLITKAKQLGDSNYYPLLMDYYSYLQTLDNLYSRDNIEFIAATLESSSHPLFGMFYPDEKAVDNVMKKEGYARNVVDRIIFKEKVAPFLNATDGKSEPDWIILYNIIVKDYMGDYADRLVKEAKIKWHQAYGNTLKYVAIMNDKIERYGSDATSWPEKRN